MVIYCKLQQFYSVITSNFRQFTVNLPFHGIKETTVHENKLNKFIKKIILLQNQLFFK